MHSDAWFRDFLSRCAKGLAEARAHDAPRESARAMRKARDVEFDRQRRINEGFGLQPEGEAR